MQSEPDCVLPIDEPSPRFPKGTRIVCPDAECGTIIGTALRDVYGSEPMSSEPWQDIVPGSKFECPACGTPYARGKLYGPWRLHTDKGWM